jgi:hypothetical protein
MIKKSLVIGAFTNYNFNQLKPWVESIISSGFSGDVVLIAVNATQDTIAQLKARNVGVVEIDDPQQKIPIHVLRFVHIHEYLTKVYQSYEFVITTDVKDVIFQYDPVVWLQTNLGDKQLVAGSESMKYKDEPWGAQNLSQAFGPYVFDKFKDNPIYNVGTLGGTSEYIKDLCLSIALSATGRPIPIVDQAVYNVMLYGQPYKEITYYAKQSDGWACQAGTTVDPSKIDTFRPLLLEAEPIYEDGVVKVGEGHYKGEPFAIVHQYDRVPDWKKAISEKYQQEAEENYFTYRV